MNVFIFGIGCSGTTMTYNLLQSIFEGKYGAGYFSSYEPYIWNREKFNCPYKDAASLFGRTSSLSIEGVHSHVTTPMFVDNALCDKYQDDEFLQHFTASGPGLPHLAKFIRGNGRMPLFRALNSSAKFLLIVRNPVDNVNCAKNKFSFFGEDFYPSDYPRFCEQLERGNQLHITGRDISWAQKQAEYCYQMNRAALHFAATDKSTEILEYDAFNSDKIASVERLCDFLDVPFSVDLVEELDQPAGPVTTSLSLSESEYEDILPYDYKYNALCEKYGLIRGKSSREIIDRYEGNCTALELNLEHVESTTNRLRNVNRALNRRVSKLEDELKRNRTA